MNEATRTEQILFRRELGDVLRDYRQRQGRTLREVSSDARVSSGICRRWSAVRRKPLRSCSSRSAER